MPVATDYTELSRAQLWTAFSLVSSLFFLWGFSYGLLDVLNQHFLDIFNLKGHTETTMLQFAYFVSYLVVAPPMGFFMRRYGYKLGIHVGLFIFMFGAIMFWPSAVYREYGMFVAFTFCCGSGLATLEVAANTYITLLGPPKHAAFRLTLAQGFNGIATVVGPLIASNAFFNGENANDLGTVQYVYLALAIFALLLNIGLVFCKLPEVVQTVSQEDLERLKGGGWKGIFKKHHTTLGVGAEFAYVGAQVAVASMAVFYLTLQPGIDPPISKASASNIFAGCQAAFTVGRFVGVAYLRFIDPAFSLLVHGLGLILFSILTSTIDGIGGIVCLFFIFFFESTCYPVIFSLASANLGPYAVVGGALTAAGVSGGAAWPSMQAAVSDASSTQRSYLIAMIGFVPLTMYGFGMWYLRCKKHNIWTIWVKHLDGADNELIEAQLREQHRRASEFGGDKQDIKHEESFLEGEVHGVMNTGGQGAVGQL